MTHTAATDDPTSPLQISVFFPCHNEVENVERVVREAHRHLAALTEDFEIIVVDDGSTDGTPERAEAVANTDSRIRVVAHPTNLGYGHALRTGFKNARKPLVTYTDGDGQFSLADLPNMLAALNGHGFVLGYRLQRADPAHRRVNAWLWTAFVRMMLGINVRDLDCGFKLFRRELVRDLEFIAGRGAVISAELIAKATRAGHSFAQVGVHHYPRASGEQSGNSLRVVANSFVDVLRLWRQLR
jgi:glycosyltransferase involved in cell wall biosynthesis